MFVRNSWTIAALAKEVTRISPLARTIMNEKIVLYRTRSGEAVALLDRCPHRFAPLSVGKVVGDDLQCGYHGMVFDRRGLCIANPTQPQDKIPRAARVKSFPIVEKDNLLWIWMGDAERADASLVPNYHYYDSPEWASDLGYLKVEANYMLALDNLIDLTHIAFVHADILGNEHAATQTSEATEVSERGLVERRCIYGAPAVPAWKAAFNDYDGDVDTWIDMYWEVGSNLILDVGVTPAGRPRDEGIGLWQLDCLTPETETSTHYFFGAAHKYRIKEPAITAFWMGALNYAFNQDKTIIEAVQENMGAEWDVLQMNPVLNKADRGALQARRILASLVALEKESRASA